MSSQFDLQAAKCKVYEALMDNAKTKDDDKLLILAIWAKESKATTLQEFFLEFMEGIISFPDTLTRARRKLQQDHESLRGDKWEVRHKMEAAFCQQLNLFDGW
jgi:hypothetical protein